MLKALTDHVIVKRVAEQADVVVNGLVRPDIAKEQPQEGFVIAVGQGSVVDGRRVPVDVKPGDRVLFGKFSGQEVTVGVEKYLILREEDLFAAFVPDPQPEVGVSISGPIPAGTSVQVVS